MLVALLLAVAASAQTAAQVAPEDEQEILRLLNHERQSRGLAPLADNERLRDAARRHSERMAAHRELGHQLAGEADLDRRLGKLRFDTAGENVAYAADATRAHSALMHSPHHRDNILDRDYNSVGIGVVREAGQIYVTQDFAHVLAESSVAQIEQTVASTLQQGHRELRWIEAPELRRKACEMAAHDHLNPRAGMLDGASGSLVFTALDPTQISDSVRNLRSRPARAFSVGACYQSSTTYENPVYWIIVVTYL